MSYEAWGEPPELPCDVCGAFADDCVCPVCPVCGEIGRLTCYDQHGIKLSEEQVQSAIRHDPGNDVYDPAEWDDP